jgi:general secretion pathway protein D
MTTQRIPQQARGGALVMLSGLISVTACSGGPSSRLPPRDLSLFEQPTQAGQPLAAGVRTTTITPLQPLRPGLPASLQAEAPDVVSPMEEISALVSEGAIEVTLPPQMLGQFVETVFGQVLGVPYVTGPGITERRDMVTLQAPAGTSKRALFAMVQMALRDFGIIVSIDNGAVRLRGPASTLSPPLILRSANGAGMPAGSGQVLQIRELRSIEVNVLLELLEDAFPDAQQVKFSARQDINSIVVSGGAQQVAAALGVIDEIDQAKFAGGQVSRIEPVYWPADRLADAVVQTLNTEGIQAYRGTGSLQRAVTFMAVPFNNQLLVFSNQPDAFARAVFWINELDRPAALGDQEAIFVYEVQNTSAEELGRVVASAGGGALGAPAAGSTGAAPAAVTTSAVAGGMINIDTVGNRILFRGSPSSYERLLQLMKTLDKPPRQVLIEMTIAEVTLTDETRFGLDWFLRESFSGGVVTGGTEDGVGLAGEGLLLNFNRFDLRVALNAFATNNNVNILSTPRLVARSGGNAKFQVGTDVPIITSQSAGNTLTPGGGTDILQTVQYRQTGVILDVAPIVYGNNRVDLTITQEVSSQQNNPNAAIGSPLILNRSVTTQLSLEQGRTAIIGGLIQDGYTQGNTGVPLLKDLPLIGGLFRSDALQADKTELLILVTPYVVPDASAMESEAMSAAGHLNQMMRFRGPQAYTLLPWIGGAGQMQIELPALQSDQ